MDRGEKAGYALAAVVLVVGGAIFRTPILNWISGPAIVIGSVALTTWTARRGHPVGAIQPETDDDAGRAA